MSTAGNVDSVTDRAAPVEAPDVDLVARVARGDRHALDALYARHAPWLVVRLSRRCPDDDLVDTAVQDTFLAVWKQAARYKPSGEVGAWIWTIGIRRLIDQLRKRPPPTPIAPSQFDLVLTEEVPLALGHTALGQAFARLDPDLQAVLAATALDGLSNREAGRLLNIPTGTVKSRLARARATLKEMHEMKEITP
jgi:RNA polymerase sigma-70 factor (ECF subfamily)